MSGQRYVHQLIVPAYVWQDGKQREAALIRIGEAMHEMGVQMRENVDLESAEVTPHGMKAVVARAKTAPEVPFVGYEQCPLAEADLVMIVVDAGLVPS